MKKLVVSMMLTFWVFPLFGADYSEKVFLYKVLENSYQAKIISNTVLSSYETEAKAGAMYNTELFAKGSYQASTNSEDEQLSRLENYSLSAGVKKMFSTRTIISLEAGETYSGSSVKTFEFIMNGFTPSFASVYSNTQLAKPFVKISVLQPLLKDGLWDMPGLLLLDINRNGQKLTTLGARMALEGLVYSTLIQYHKFLTDLELLSINQESLNDSRALLEKYRGRAKLGAVDESDLNRFEAQLIRQEINFTRSRQQLDNDLDALKTALKTNITLEEIRVVDAIILETNIYSEDAVIAEAMSNKADLLQARIISQNAGLGYRIAQNSALPDLGLTASYTARGAGANAGWYPLHYSDFFVGLEFKMPILAPSERAKILESQYQKENAELDLAARQDKLLLDLRAGINALSIRKSSIEKSTRLVDLYQKLYIQARKDYENGKVSSRELQQATDEYRSAKVALASENLQNKLSLLNIELQKGSLLGSYGISVFNK